MGPKRRPVVDGFLDWSPIVLAMGVVWRRRWWRFLIGGLNRPLIFMALFAWNFGRGSETGDYLGFLVPGLLVMAGVTASYSDLVNWFTLRRTYFRVLDEYMLAPISTGSLLVGHVLGAAGKGFVTALAVFLLAHLFKRNFAVSPLLFLQLFIVCLTFASLAVGVAMIAGGDRDALLFTNLVVFPMTFFCGTFFPVESLPGVVSAASWFLPLTAATYNLRSLTLTGANHFEWFLQSIFWFAGSFLLAYILLRMRAKE